MARIRSKGGASQKFSGNMMLPGLRRKLRNVEGSVLDEVREAISISIVTTHSAVKRKISRGTRSGALYSGGGRSGPHRASAPGEPPKTDFGDLVKGIIHSIDADGMGGEVISHANTSRWLEFGTTKMNARPFLVPTMEEQKPKARARVKAAMKRGAKKGANK